MARFPALIEPEALAARLQQTEPPRILDATYHLPPSLRDAREEFRRAHVPGAQFFDIDAIADQRTSLPHMVPDAETFARAVGDLGVGTCDEVVVYDAHGLFSAPRVWWLFRYFGHERICVLNGGLPHWRALNLPLADGDHPAQPRVYQATPRPELLKTWQDVHDNLSDPRFTLIDYRSAGRFEGREPEPRPGLREGHAPGSRNLPWTELIDPQTQRMREVNELAQAFSQRGLSPQAPLACSCGSGITACVGALALYLLGQERAAVYDGSWAEWGAREDSPVTSGSDAR